MTLWATASRRPATSSSGPISGGALEQPVAHARAGDGRQAQHGLRGGAQGLDAQHERVGQVGRQALAAGGGRQLLGEERVALGAGEELVDQARLGPAAEDPGQLRHHLLAREALERHALDDRGALGLGHERSQGMAAVQLVGAVGGEQQDALLAGVAHEEGQEVARRPVGPVDVLEDEHERLRLGQAPQQREQQLEHAPLRGRRLRGGGVELGEQRREADRAPAQLVGAQPPQGADDRREGQLAVAEVDAVAGEHARALFAGAGGELRDQPRLADARLAGDEHDRGPPVGGALQSGAEPGQLALAPHELRTRDPLGQLPRPSTARVYAAVARAAHRPALGSRLDAPSPPRPRARLEREPRPGVRLLRVRARAAHGARGRGDRALRGRDRPEDRARPAQPGRARLRPARRARRLHLPHPVADPAQRRPRVERRRLRRRADGRRPPLRARRRRARAGHRARGPPRQRRGRAARRLRHLRRR